MHMFRVIIIWTLLNKVRNEFFQQYIGTLPYRDINFFFNSEDNIEFPNSAFSVSTDKFDSCTLTKPTFQLSLSDTYRFGTSALPILDSIMYNSELIILTSHEITAFKVDSIGNFIISKSKEWIKNINQIITSKRTLVKGSSIGKLLIANELSLTVLNATNFALIKTQLISLKELKFIELFEDKLLISNGTNTISIWDVSTLNFIKNIDVLIDNLHQNILSFKLLSTNIFLSLNAVNGISLHQLNLENENSLKTVHSKIIPIMGSIDFLIFNEETLLIYGSMSNDRDWFVQEFVFNATSGYSQINREIFYTQPITSVTVNERLAVISFSDFTQKVFSPGIPKYELDDSVIGSQIFFLKGTRISLLGDVKDSGNNSLPLEYYFFSLSDSEISSFILKRISPRLICYYESHVTGLDIFEDGSTTIYTNQCKEKSLANDNSLLSYCKLTQRINIHVTNRPIFEAENSILYLLICFGTMILLFILIFVVVTLNRRLKVGNDEIENKKNYLELSIAEQEQTERSEDSK